MRNILLFLLLSATLSCSKDDDLSPAQQIKELIESQNFDRIVAAKTIDEYNAMVFGTPNEQGFIYTIDGNFLIIDDVAWNLNRVSHYTTRTIDNKSILGLFFD
jgi:hypothetical protein